MKTIYHDIRVALLGNVSTGKTMTMNALFGNKYGEVSMKRTTAAVNYFKISTSSKSEDGTAKDKDTATATPPSDEKSHSTNTTTSGWHPGADEPRTAESTLKEISDDNRKLRDEDTGNSYVQEKWFDIELDEPLCEMRSDTRLVIVDIPGINEAGACNKYKEYVDKNWHAFDCVVLVMDGKQGVNTEDQVYLLNLVHRNKKQIKNVPVIILFNKVDDPEDQEQAELIREAYQEIQALFTNKTKELHAKKTKAPTDSTCTSTNAPNTSTNAPNPFGCFSAWESPGSAGGFSVGTASGGGFSFGATKSASPKQKAGFSFGGGGAKSGFSFGAAQPSATRESSTGFPFAQAQTNPQASPITFGQALPNTAKLPATFSFGKQLSKNVERTTSPDDEDMHDALESHDEAEISGHSSEKVGPDQLENLFSDLPPSVAFVPISSLHGFVNRCASGMSFNDFCDFFDKELIEKVGKEQIGRRQWKKLSDEERTRAVYDMLNDPDECHEVLQDSRFDKFMFKLGDFVGGKDTQTRLLEEQIQVALKMLLLTVSTEPTEVSFETTTGKKIAQHIHDAYSKMQSLQDQRSEAKELKKAFWKAYFSMETVCFQNIATFGPRNLHVLSEPIDELVAFHGLAKQVGWSEEARQVIVRFKVLFKQMVDLLVRKASGLPAFGHRKPAHRAGREPAQAASGPPFQVTTKPDGGTTVYMQSISAMPAFQTKSFEELRFEDFSQGNHGSQGAAPAPGPSGGLQAPAPDSGIQTVTDPWNMLSPLDWSTIWSSLLLLSYDRHFCLDFGVEKIIMERELHHAQVAWSATWSIRSCPQCQGDLPAECERQASRLDNAGQPVHVFYTKCGQCQTVFLKEEYSIMKTPCTSCLRCGHRGRNAFSLFCSSCPEPLLWSSVPSPKEWAGVRYDKTNDKWVPWFPDKSTKISSIPLVESLENKIHIGHIAYRYCEFMHGLKK